MTGSEGCSSAVPLATLEFLEPGVLAGLVGVAGLLWFARRSVAARGWTGVAILALRGLTLAALVVALARPRHLDVVDDLAVAFVVDVSESVPLADRDRHLRRIERAFAQLKGTDQASLIVFGSRPSVEVPFTGASGAAGDAGVVARLENLESRMARWESDLALAVDFARGTFPPDVARRIVLVSDGNQTRGDLESVARSLASAGVRLDVAPVTYSYDEEVIVEGLRGPGRGRIDEPLQLRAVISSQAATEARITLLENGVPLGPPTPVRLEAGTNVFRFAPTPGAPGYFQYEMRVDAERDGNRANDVGRASVLVGGPPQVLVVSEEDSEGHLAQGLIAAGVAITRGVPPDVPRHPAGFVGVDAVVLDDVAAWRLDDAQKEALRDAVKELGVGLVTVGGPHAFGPGGYRGTPLEELLPVDLDVRNKRSLPKGALVVVLHSIEFDSGNTWAVRICNSALRGLSETDEAGIVYYDWEGAEKWLFDLAPIGDGVVQARLIQGVQVGDMPSFHNCFVLAEQSLSRSDAAVKHVVVISDGDPAVPTPALIARLVAQRVTISTICIEPHGPGSVPAMQRLAQQGSGRFYQLFPSQGDLDQLPRLLLKESATLRRSAVREEPFVPVVTLPGSPLIRGIDGWPKLDGYVVTTVRDGAETVLLADEKESDPLLAAWHVGLGRSVAFTSAASSRWAGAWLGWERFGPFWTQVVRSCVLEGDTSPYPVTVNVEGLTLDVSLEARDALGAPITDLDIEGVAMSEGQDPVSFALTQRAAGIFGAAVEVPGQGHWLVRLTYRDGERPVQALGVAAIDFAPEYRSLRSDDALLRSAAELAGGRVMAEGDDPFRHDITGVRGQVALWPWCVGFAVAMVILELIVRRLDVNPFAAAAGGVTRIRERARARSADAPAPAVRRYDPGPVATPTGDPVPEGPRETRPPARPDEVMDELKKAKRRAEKRREWK